MSNIRHGLGLQLVFDYSQIVNHAVKFEFEVIPADEVHLRGTVESYIHRVFLVHVTFEFIDGSFLDCLSDRVFYVRRKDMCNLFKFFAIVLCNVQDTFVRVNSLAKEFPFVPVVFTDVQLDVPDVRQVPEDIRVDESLNHVGFSVQQTLFADLEDGFAHFFVLVVGFEPEPDLVFGFCIRLYTALVEHGHGKHLFRQFVNFSLTGHAVCGYSLHPVGRYN